MSARHPLLIKLALLSLFIWVCCADAVRASESSLQIRDSRTSSFPSLSAETITSTTTHPFWVTNRIHAQESKGTWIAAENLRPGDRVLLSDGTEAVLISKVSASDGREGSLQTTPQSNGHTTYNLSVADDQTYFVGHAGIWVHNTGHPCKYLPKNPKVKTQFGNYNVPDPFPRGWLAKLKYLFHGNNASPSLWSFFPSGDEMLIRPIPVPPWTTRLRGLLKRGPVANTPESWTFFEPVIVDLNRNRVTGRSASHHFHKALRNLRSNPSQRYIRLEARVTVSRHPVGTVSQSIDSVDYPQGIVMRNIERSDGKMISIPEAASGNLDVYIRYHQALWLGNSIRTSPLPMRRFLRVYPVWENID